jgi:hypothetical protein
MGDATVNGKYCQVGDIVFVYLKVIFGSTTSWANGAAVYFDVPVAIHSDDQGYSFRGSVTFFDTGTAKYHGTMRPVGNDYGFIPEEYGLAGTTVGSLLKGGNLQGDNPFVWATGDELICNFWYRSA